LTTAAFQLAALFAPGALGESNPVASNETASGRAENRRADVKLLVNKGIAGASGDEN
jgi:hypothetical protein